MPPPTLPHPDLHATLAALRSGHTSLAEVRERCWQIARSDACRHAFIRLVDPPAESPGAEGRGPLAGLPVSVKDLFDVEGQVTAAGSLALADTPPAAGDADAVHALRRAGACVQGRTNMSEFAFSGIGVNPHYGTPSNPTDPVTPRIPGGSSSGAAVSVATGAAFIGLGSDTGGSIRIPAALQGIVGFKNTARLTSTRGAIPLSTTLDTVCALTRSVRDAVLAHEILAARTVVRGCSTLASARFLVPGNAMLDQLDPEVASAFAQALTQLSAQGAQLVERNVPAIDGLGAIMPLGGFAAAESFAWHRDMLARRGDVYDPRVRIRIERGQAISAADYLTMFTERKRWIDAMRKALQGFDAALSPTVPIVAPPIASVAPGAAQDAEFFRVNALLLRNTSVVNMQDGCAISIPCQRAGDRPVGLMIWQAGGRDDTVLHAAGLAESALGART